MKLFSRQGFGVLGAVIMMTVLSMLTGAVVHVIASGQVTQANHLVREQAFYNTQAGIEYALMQIANGTDPNGMQKDFAGGTFTIVYNPSTGAATISANKSGYFAASNKSYAVLLPSMLSEADCLTVNVSGAYLASSSTRLQGLTLQNTCASATNIDSMSVSWAPASTAKMNTIRFQTTNVYSNSSGVGSGTLVDIRQDSSTTWWPIPANSTHNLTYIAFNSNMSLKNFTLHFVMKDGSTKDAFVQFLANDQASCLQVNTSLLNIGGTGYTDYLGVTLRNNCTSSIQITKMTLTWPGSQTLRQILVAGATLWSGSASSGTVNTLSSVAQSAFAAGQTRNQTRLRFSGDMRGRNLVVTYTMSDNTTQTVNYTLYAANMGSCLVVTTVTSLSSNQKDLLGETWRNNCTQSVVVDTVKTTWSPLNPSSDLVQVRINSATVWSGRTASGTIADIDNQTMSSGVTMQVDRYRFDPSVMTSRCFTHTITMTDGTSVDVSSFCPI